MTVPVSADGCGYLLRMPLADGTTYGLVNADRSPSRFDLGDCGWVHRLGALVSQHVRHLGLCPASVLPLCPEVLPKLFVCPLRP